MTIPEFLLSVAVDGFTRACAKYKVNGPAVRMMYNVLKDKGSDISPFCPKREIVFTYIADQVKTSLLDAMKQKERRNNSNK